MHAVGSRTAAVAIALTMLVGLVAIGSREPLRGTTDEPAATREAPENVTVIAPVRGFPVPGALPPEVFVIEEDSAMPAWVGRAIVGAAAAVIAIALLRLLRGHRVGLRRRRRRRKARRGEAGSEAADTSSAGPEDDAELARHAVEAALEPLRDLADPRGAVIAAYARMEQVLAARELGRRTAEAPREYLARVLREQGMPERSLTTLTALFEEARFSRHPIPESAPLRALGELENTRIALAAIDTPSRI